MPFSLSKKGTRCYFFGPSDHSMTVFLANPFLYDNSSSCFAKRLTPNFCYIKLTFFLQKIYKSHPFVHSSFFFRVFFLMNQNTERKKSTSPSIQQPSPLSTESPSARQRAPSYPNGITFSPTLTERYIYKCSFVFF